MSKKSIQNIQTGNQLLAALPPEDYKNLLAKSELTELNFGKTIYESDDIIRNVYFPKSGIISLLSTIDSQSILEIGIVGREGMVGLPVFLGVNRSKNKAIVQGKGKFLKVKTADFLKECEKSKILSRLLQRFAHSFLTQVSQSAVCNRFHQTNVRLARWLLMTHDRMETDEFVLTQEFLSNMLGVRREAVTIAASNFQQQKLISYTRGKITVLDRAGLEAISCRCYTIIKNEEQNIFREKD